MIYCSQAGRTGIGRRQMSTNTAALKNEMAREMAGWTKSDFEREAAFAESCNDGSRECLAWIATIARESVKRFGDTAVSA